MCSSDLVEVVKAVADQNHVLAGGSSDLSWAQVDNDGLARALRFASPGRLTVQDLVATELLQGQRPQPRSDSGVIAPKMGPGGPRMPPPGGQGQRGGQGPNGPNGGPPGGGR